MHCGKTHFRCDVTTFNGAARMKPMSDACNGLAFDDHIANR
jgi:hypothetical protein